nr:hypothetical protein [Stenotrophomonas pavanii]
MDTPDAIKKTYIITTPLSTHRSPLIERLPFGSKGKHCNTAQAPKPPINLDDSDCSEYFRSFTLDFQQHPVSRKCVYPHGTQNDGSPNGEALNKPWHSAPPFEATGPARVL